MPREKCRHCFRIARPWQGTGDDDPVVAQEHPGEAVAVTLGQQCFTLSPRFPASPVFILSCLVPALPAWELVRNIRGIAGVWGLAQSGDGMMRLPGSTPNSEPILIKSCSEFKRARRTARKKES